MTTGSKLLRDLGAARSDVESKLRTAAKKISALQGDLGQIMAEEGKLWNAFAAIQIGEQAVLPSHIEAMLQKRKDRIASENATVKEAGKRIDALAGKRAAAAAAAEKDHAELRKQEAGVQAVLAANPRANALLVEITGLKEAAEGLDHKRERAFKEFQDKRTGYENDELFVYLMNRKYGTDEYRGWSVVKHLDGWLAGLISFKKKSGDYKRLRDIPAWIEARQEKTESDLQEKDAAAAALHDQAFSAIKDFYALADRSRGELEAIDAAIKNEQDVVHAASAYIANAALAADQDMQTATKAFADMLSRNGVNSLAEAAAKTDTKEDDAIVEKLAALGRQKASISAQVESLRPGLLEFERRVKAVKEVEDRIRSRGWSGSDDRFNSSVSSSAPTDLAQGLITAAALWSSLQSSHTQESQSGSSGYGSSGYGSPSGSSGGFGGSDTWSTGGGIGGGDSSTGGGF